MKLKFSEKIYKKYLKIIPELKKNESIENLWDIISEMYNIDASIYIKKTDAKINFTINETDYTISHDPSEIQTFAPNGNIREENYNLLLKDALEYIILNKLITKKKNKKSRSKK